MNQSSKAGCPIIAAHPAVLEWIVQNGFNEYERMGQAREAAEAATGDPITIMDFAHLVCHAIPIVFPESKPYDCQKELRNVPITTD